MKKLRPPVKTHGGKFYLSDWIIDNFPVGYEDLTYIEPFCAGASVFLNKKPSKVEVLNDLDRGVTSIFKSLRDESEEFLSKIKEIEYNEKTFRSAMKKAKEPMPDYVEKAVNEYTLRRMSRGGMRKSFAWSDRERNGKPGDVNSWETMIEQLNIIIERVKETFIFNSNALDVMKVWDEEDTLWYLDPPYLPNTRTEGAKKVYEYEMSVDDHLKLLQMAKNARGKVIISGYNSPLYNRTLKGWRVEKKDIVNHSGQNDIKEHRVEVIWMNFDI